MSYIKIDHSNLQQAPHNYTYFIELDDNNSFLYGIIVGVDKNEQERNKILYGQPSGDLWEWLNSRDGKFSDDEIKRYSIPKEEFDKIRENSVREARGNN